MARVNVRVQFLSMKYRDSGRNARKLQLRLVKYCDSGMATAKVPFEPLNLRGNCGRRHYTQMLRASGRGGVQRCITSPKKQSGRR